jgi:hypothetical protein
MFKSDDHKKLDQALLNLSTPFFLVCSGLYPPAYFDEALEKRQDEIVQLVAAVRASEGEKGIKKARNYIGTYTMNNIAHDFGRPAYNEFMSVVDSLIGWSA